MTSSGCLWSPQILRLQADRIGQAAGFSRREWKAGPFVLTGYLREGPRGEGGTLAVYIEGDGHAWDTRQNPSSDPTPRHPVALGLAAEDPSSPVLYLARPGQFSSLPAQTCPQEYWTGKRFSDEVVAAMDEVISRVKREMQAEDVHLAGFSGGAAIAVLVAARRDDVRALRTVAGNLDPEAVNCYHRVSSLAGSLDPLQVAERLGNIPQRHFIGGRDRIIPAGAVYAFVEKAGDPEHRSVMECPEAGHQGPWVSRWRELLHEPLEHIQQ